MADTPKEQRRGGDRRDKPKADSDQPATGATTAPAEDATDAASAAGGRRKEPRISAETGDLTPDRRDQEDRRK